MPYKLKYAFLFLATVSFPFASFAQYGYLTSVPGQIILPSPPVPQSFSPITVNPGYGQPAYNPVTQAQFAAAGATAADIIRQTQQADAYRMGVNRPMSREDQELWREINAESEAQRRAAQQKQLEFQRQEAITKSIAACKNLLPALRKLDAMLDGESKLSLADAYYISESAYGNCYLSKQEYHAIIDRSAAFVKAWMKENGLDLHDDYMVHYAIQKFISKPLTLSAKTGSVEFGQRLSATTHAPFRYDYQDYSGDKDPRDLFVTKCLATGYGQCASMPVVYLLLAEKLGVKAYLSMAPQHSFIKYPDNSGFIKNYEPTSGWEISDKWYKDNMAISPEAVASGIYLDTMDTRQIVGECVLNLAISYLRLDRTMNGNFILDCLNAADQAFPDDNHLQSLLIRDVHYRTQIDVLAQQKGLNQANRLSDPEIRKLYEARKANDAHIKQLGYRDFPSGMYEQLLEEHEFKGKLQRERGTDSKAPKSLFQTVSSN